MPSKHKGPTKCSTSPMDLAQKTLVTLTHLPCRPISGKVVVETHSMLLEVKIVPSITSKATIQVLRSIFAARGLPDVIISDNRTAFISSKFKEFIEKNGIRHITSPPYHPASNGLSDRAFEERIRKITDGVLETRLAQLLFQYRITPHSTTCTSSAELLMGQ